MVRQRRADLERKWRPPRGWVYYNECMNGMLREWELQRHTASRSWANFLRDFELWLECDSIQIEDSSHTMLLYQSNRSTASERSTCRFGNDIIERRTLVESLELCVAFNNVAIKKIRSNRDVVGQFYRRNSIFVRRESTTEWYAVVCHFSRAAQRPVRRSRVSNSIFRRDEEIFSAFSVLLQSQRQIAMISEIIHVASLLHDDVIDLSDIRRGKSSVNVLWNQKKVSWICDFCSPFFFYDFPDAK